MKCILLASPITCKIVVTFQALKGIELNLSYLWMDTRLMAPGNSYTCLTPNFHILCLQCKMAVQQSNTLLFQSIIAFLGHSGVPHCPTAPLPFKYVLGLFSGAPSLHQSHKSDCPKKEMKHKDRLVNLKIQHNAQAFD